MKEKNLSSPEPLTYDHVKTIINKVMNGLNLRFYDEREDILQEVYLEHLSDPQRSIKYMVIDYLRRMSGRKDRKYYGERLKLYMAEELLEQKCVNQPDEELMVMQLLERLEPRRRAVFKMRAEGYAHWEIGKTFGFDAGYSCQLFKKASQDLLRLLRAEVSPQSLPVGKPDPSDPL